MNRVGAQTVYLKGYSSLRPKSFLKPPRLCEADGKIEASQWDALSDRQETIKHSHTPGSDSYDTAGGGAAKAHSGEGSTHAGSTDPAMTPGRGVCPACVWLKRQGPREWKGA